MTTLTSMVTMKYTRMTVHSFRLYPIVHSLDTIAIAKRLSLPLDSLTLERNLMVAISVVVNATGDNEGLALVSLLL